MKALLVFILVFGLIVTIHELGHFLFAKWSGILVREFSIGMGPKVFAHQAKDGTTYTLRLLPVGGYVRMAGMGEEEADLTAGQTIGLVLNEQQRVVKINTSEKVQLPNALPMELVKADLEDELMIVANVYYAGGREQRTYQVEHDATIIEADGTEVRIAPLDVQFQSAKLYQRLLTNFAGPLFNFILTFALFFIMLNMQGGIYEAELDSGKIGGIQAESLADEIGLKAGDEIVSIDNQPIREFTDISKELEKAENKEIQMTIKRQKSEKQLTLTPKEVTQEDGTKRIMLGVVPATRLVPLNIGGKLKEAVHQTTASALLIFRALKDLVSDFSLNKLGGPVMIFQASSQVANESLLTILRFTAILSVNLGIMNLLPIPMLDGGKILFNLIEGIRRKPLNPELEARVTFVGFALLMLLMVLVTWNDILRFFTK